MTRNKIVNGLLEVFAILFLSLVITGIVIWLVYTTIGELTPQGIHILATGEFFGVFGALLLGLSLSKRHEAGIKTGLQIKTSASAPRPKRDEWRPKPERQPQIQRTIIVQRRGEIDDRIDL